MQEIISFFKYLATSNTINFIIMIVILAVIVKKINVRASLDKSVETIKNTIENSDIEREKAQALLLEAKQKTDALPSDILNLEKEAKSKAEVFKKQIENSTKTSITDIEKNIDRVISIEEKKLSNVITGKTAVASIELAKDNIKNLLKTNPDLHSKFIYESLDELEKVKL